MGDQGKPSMGGVWTFFGTTQFSMCLSLLNMKSILILLNMFRMLY